MENAMNDYLASDYERSRSMLVGVVEACETRCSADVLARGWMYLYLVNQADEGTRAASRQLAERALLLAPELRLPAHAKTDQEAIWVEAGGRLERTE
jgi:hypothetical protein